MLALPGNRCTFGDEKLEGSAVGAGFDRHFASARVVAQYSTLVLTFRRLRKNVDADSKYVSSIQDCLHGRVLAQTQVVKRNPRSIAIELRTLIKKDLHWLIAVDAQGDLIAHRVHFLNLATQDRAL